MCDGTTFTIGRSGGAKVLGKLLELGRPTNLDNIKARAFCACSRFRWGLLPFALAVGSGGGWLVGCFGFNGPLRQYFSLYRAVFQREGGRKEKR